MSGIAAGGAGGARSVPARPARTFSSRMHDAEAAKAAARAVGALEDLGEKGYKMDVEQWRRRVGLEAGQRVFNLTGAYPDVRDELLRRGWKRNMDMGSPHWDLSFTLKSADIKHHTLKPHQVANHFPKAGQITTKAGLLHTLKDVGYYAPTHADCFYPRAYDLSDQHDYADFVDDFRCVEALRLLRGVLVAVAKRWAAAPGASSADAALLTGARGLADGSDATGHGLARWLNTRAPAEVQAALCQPSVEAAVAACGEGDAPLLVNAGVLDTALQVAHKRCRSWDDDTLDGQGEEGADRDADGVAALPPTVTPEEWQVLRYCDVHLPGGPAEQASGTLRREAQGKEVERAVNIRRQALMRRAVKRGHALSGEALARVFTLSSVPTLSAFLSARQRSAGAGAGGGSGGAGVPPLVTATDLAAMAAAEDPATSGGAESGAGGEVEGDGDGVDDGALADADDEGGGGDSSSDDSDDDQDADGDDDDDADGEKAGGDGRGGAGGVARRGAPAPGPVARLLHRAHTMPAAAGTPAAAGSGAAGAKRLTAAPASGRPAAAAAAAPPPSAPFGAPPPEENLDDFNNGILSYGGRFKDRSVVTAVNLKLWRERLMREGASDGVTDVFNKSLGNPIPTVTAASDARFASVAPLTVAQWRRVAAAVADLQGASPGNQRFLDALVPRNAWIVKPAGKSRGRGIECARTLADILDARGGDGHRESQWIAQRYIERPLLIHGLKWDVRQWVLVTAMNPLTVYVYDRFYLRFCCYPFELDNLSNRYIHLSNNSIQKHAAVFDATAIEGNMWHMAAFGAWLQDRATAGAWEGLTYVPDPAAQAGDCNRPPWDGEGAPPAALPVSSCPNILECVIRPQMRRLITHSLQAAQDRMEGRPGSFELYGYDFMVDADLSVWLIEINASPDLSYSTPVTEELVKEACADLFAVVLDREGMGVGPPPNPDADTGGWKCVYRSPVTLPRTLTCTAHSIVCTGTALRPPVTATAAGAGAAGGATAAAAKRKLAVPAAAAPLRSSTRHANAAAPAAPAPPAVRSVAQPPKAARIGGASAAAAAPVSGSTAASLARPLRRAPSHSGSGGAAGMGLASSGGGVSSGGVGGTVAAVGGGGSATTGAAAAAVKQRATLRLAAGQVALLDPPATAAGAAGATGAAAPEPVATSPSALSPSLTGRSSIPVHRSHAGGSGATAVARLADAFDGAAGKAVRPAVRPSSATGAAVRPVPRSRSTARTSRDGARSISRGASGGDHGGADGGGLVGLAVTVGAAPVALRA